MRKDLLALGLGMVLSGVTVFSSLGAGSPVRLHGHVPAAVERAQTQATGQLDTEKTMQISLGLPLRNQGALSNLLQQLSDPKSPNYGHYMTTAQFTELFGPTEQDYQKVIEFAQQHNLTITAKHASRQLLSVSGKAADVEKAFQVTLRTYRHPRENRSFFAPDTDPIIDSGLKIIHVSGLDDYSLPRPHYQKRDLNQANLTAQATNPNRGSGPGGTYAGADFHNAYNLPSTTLIGSGQSIGLLQFDGFYPADITAYETRFLGTFAPNLVVIPIDGGVPVPTPIGNPEVSLDIEMVVSMAPALANVYVYEAPNPSPWVDILSRMADDNLARQLSCSWGGGPPDPVAEQIFQQMAVQGQTFYNASGDSDAFIGDISFPSDSPHITEVGGTTLATDRNAQYTAESVWNWGITQNRDGVGSSGGISTFYSIPSWQTNINMPARNGSSTRRNVPDVALTADNIFVNYGNGQSGGFGGTSCAAPLWAGLTALVNQQAAMNGRPAVGFVNPALYALAATPNYANCFHDIVAGNNTWSSSPTLFQAGNGYDLCTGLGTPNGANLITALAASSTTVSHISPPPAPYGATLAALAGGNPNGGWELFIQDDAPISAGLIANGWVLSLTTADFVGTAADLELLMSTTNSSALVGQPVTFVLTVTNYGPSISTNVSVVDTLPLTTTVLGTNVTQGSVSRAGSTLTWNVGTLAVNAGAQLVLTVQPNSIGSLLNSAIADAGTPDPNPDENVASTNVNVGTLAVTLTPVVSSTNGSFHITVPGGGASFTVVIQANSNLVSTNWVNIYTGTPPIDFVDPARSNYVNRFYRALLLP